MNGNPEISAFVVAVDARHARLTGDDQNMHPTLIFGRQDIELDKEPLYDESP